MKFIPRQIKENVNISQTFPLKEFFVLLGGISGILFALYLILGFALDIIIDRMPLGFEQRLGGFFSKKFSFLETSSEVELAAQKLVDDLASYLAKASYQFRVHIIEEEKINAVALPGGHILVYSGLLEEIETENELAMVLAHELGHFANRDHLRGMGRGLVAAAFSSFIFGFDSAVNNFMMKMLLTTDRRFSRQQEAAADSFAVDLLYKKYGHVAGAIEFFGHLDEYAKSIPGFLKYFLTHPLHTKRIELLRKRIASMGYETKESIPLDPVYKKGEE
ncbi:MAG: M48 family metallopeptidase [Candidatus Omnitrophota bacterium]